jgi:ACS family pantothenate transporter-like MFS transporter
MKNLEASCGEEQEQNIMLLPWRSQDPRDSDPDEQDEATVALLPKPSDDKIPNDDTSPEDWEDDGISHNIKPEKPPWWAFIWVRSLTP